jgi:Short C-terminal domain
VGLFKSKKKKAEELFLTGSKGAGTVIQVQDTGMTINDNPRVAMIFRVEPLDGGPAFDLTKTTTVSRVQVPRQGDRYPVWYDPQDLEKWAYAAIDDDTGRATIREQFGAVAETFVGMNAPAAPIAATPSSQVQDTAAALSQLADLHKQGLLTKDEFDAQKAKLLSQG